jgi:3-methyladenine DNA glycosylase AlkC
MPDHPAPSPLKDWFDEARHRSIARQLAGITPAFATAQFLESVLDGLESRSLMARLHQCALAAGNALPGTYREKVGFLRLLAPELKHEFVAIFPCDFVASHGLDDFEFSLEALRYFTHFGSAEFAIRTFLQADLARTLEVMDRWTSDPEEKVRRLASEGSRPRLPWGAQLPALILDPSPTVSILEALKDDPSLFVRRSVANHLNDVSKNHPQRVIEQLQSWDLERHHLRWIASHACRTLVKKGHPGALHLLGFGRPPEITATLTVSPATLSLGQRLTLDATLTTPATITQKLVVDYVIHYVKADGHSTEKVFKWTTVTLTPRTSITLTKSQLIRDFTTRRHHAGRHRIDLQINGIRVAETSFQLE